MKPVFKNPDGTSTRWMIGVLPEMKLQYSEDEAFVPGRAARIAGPERQECQPDCRIPARDSWSAGCRRRICPGPIGIAHYATEAAQEGPGPFLMLMSVVSLNLAIVNLLPIPILDGGVILTLLIEMVMGRDLSLNVKEAMLKVGFVFLMMLVVFVIYNDIAKRFTPGLLMRLSLNAGAEPDSLRFHLVT